MAGAPVQRVMSSTMSAGWSFSGSEDARLQVADHAADYAIGLQGDTVEEGVAGVRVLVRVA